MANVNIKPFKPEESDLTYSKAEHLPLRVLGFNEFWLQDRIAEDPSLLGLGDLELRDKERRQPGAGRLDLLFSDVQNETRFVTEVMLGQLDESHIIRTVEYWDLERKRFPNYEHKAVIIAEDITSRFLNVISLLNNSVPIVALQVSALKFEEKIALTFTKVLDVLEAIEETEEPAERTDRSHWEKKANAESLQLNDQLFELAKALDPATTLTYNKYHIAFGGCGVINFMWVHPRKSPHAIVDVLVGEANIDETIKKIESLGIETRNRRKGKFSLSINQDTLKKHHEAIQRLLETAISASKNRQG